MAGNTALLVIDVQNGFFLEQRSVYHGREVVGVIKDLIAKARAVNIPIIYVQHNIGNEIDGTSLWEIHSDITPIEDDIIIQKYTPDSFYNTDLQKQLQAKGVEHIILTGFSTEYCIDTACRRAWSLGYKVTLVKDGHSTFDSPVLLAEKIIEHHSNLLSAFATVLEANEIRI
jgi:nicotinamidase-related amidase